MAIWGIFPLNCPFSVVNTGGNPQGGALMATSRFREVITYYNFTPRTPGSQERRYSRFAIDYRSNRESGQVVKRESPFEMGFATLTRIVPGQVVDVVNWRPHFDAATILQPSASRAYGRAYAKFKQLAEMPRAEALLNIVERNKSLAMISARAFQLREFANALRKGQLKHAFEYMRLNPDSSLLSMKNGRRRDSRFVSGKQRQDSMDDARAWRQLVKDVSSVILEYRYGWSPLMQDIKAACDVISKPIPDAPIRASSSISFTYLVNNGYGDTPCQATDRCTIKGRVRVSNPALDLANRMGLLNPASVAWEAVPFSFVVDWFLPVGNFLGNLTDFVGCDLIDTSITATRTWYVEKDPGYVYKGATGTDLVFSSNRASGRGKVMKRAVGVSLPRPPLQFGTGLTPGRAINAVALLLQSLNPRAGARTRGE